MSATTIAPEAPPTTATLTLPAVEALYLARVGASAASKDWVTPTICGVQFSAEDGIVTVLATDRYRVHRARLSVEGASMPEVILPRVVVDWVISNAAFFGRKTALKPVVTFDFDLLPEPGVKHPGGKVTVTVREHEAAESDSLSYRTALVAGNYPPIGRLIDRALEAPTVPDDGFLNLSYLSKARSLALGKEMPRMRFVNTSTVAGKPGQTLVVYERGVALLQKSAGAF